MWSFKDCVSKVNVGHGKAFKNNTEALLIDLWYSFDPIGRRLKSEYIMRKYKVPAWFTHMS